MALFAISDLHLAIGMDKPMDIFGNFWENHTRQIEQSWKAMISGEDTIVIPGDISWGMTLDQARPDFLFLENLPGEKIILKGNHDYWWSSVTKIEKYFQEQGFSSIRLLRNNCYRVDESTLLCGARGWTLPCEPSFKQADDIIFRRELGRLDASLSMAAKMRTPQDRIIVALHYPPLLPVCVETEFTQMLESYRVDQCLFGHIHGSGNERSYEGDRNGVLYRNISADKLSFKPLRL